MLITFRLEPFSRGISSSYRYPKPRLRLILPRPLDRDGEEENLFDVGLREPQPVVGIVTLAISSSTLDFAAVLDDRDGKYDKDGVGDENPN